MLRIINKGRMTKRWRKGKEKEEMKGGGSAIQHQRKSTGRKPGDSWRVVTSQAVGLDHIRESTDTKAKSSLCPWHCCPECQKCLLLLFCWFSTLGHVPDEKTSQPSRHQRSLPCPSCPSESSEGPPESALSCGKGHSSPEDSP